MRTIGEFRQERVKLPYDIESAQPENISKNRCISPLSQGQTSAMDFPKIKRCPPEAGGRVAGNVTKEDLL